MSEDTRRTALLEEDGASATDEAFAPDAPAEAPPRVHGLLAEFEEVDTVKEAARQIRLRGYHHWDVHSPFPIHGIDEAMGIRRTILPWLVFGGGLTGTMAGLVLVWFTNAFDYPFLISGKPLFSLQANVPVIFETTVLLAALTTVFGMLLLNKLPMLYNPLFKHERFRRVTNDRFMIAIEARDPLFDIEETAGLLKSLGASAVEVVED